MGDLPIYGRPQPSVSHSEDVTGIWGVSQRILPVDGAPTEQTQQREYAT